LFLGVWLWICPESAVDCLNNLLAIDLKEDKVYGHRSDSVFLLTGQVPENCLKIINVRK
jgi:hypothetical protein